MWHDKSDPESYVPSRSPVVNDESSSHELYEDAFGELRGIGGQKMEPVIEPVTYKKKKQIEKWLENPPDYVPKDPGEGDLMASDTMMNLTEATVEANNEKIMIGGVLEAEPGRLQELAGIKSGSYTRAFKKKDNSESLQEFPSPKTVTVSSYRSRLDRIIEAIQRLNAVGVSADIAADIARECEL